MAIQPDDRRVRLESLTYDAGRASLELTSPASCSVCFYRSKFRGAEQTEQKEHCLKNWDLARSISSSSNRFRPPRTCSTTPSSAPEAECQPSVFSQVLNVILIVLVIFFEIVIFHHNPPSDGSLPVRWHRLARVPHSEGLKRAIQALLGPCPGGLEL